MAIKIVFANHKGGVGKTVTTVNTAYGLAKRGYKVLVVDCDPQGNATMTLSGKAPFDFEDEESLTAIFTSDEVLSFSSLATPTQHDKLWLIPNNVNIFSALSSLNPNSVKRFYGFMNAYLQDRDGFDFILFDTPPTLEGALIMNALVVTDYVIVPIESESSYALSGISSLIKTFNAIKKEAGTKSKILGYLLTRFDGRTKAAKIIQQASYETFGKKLVFDIGIPATTVVNQAVMENRPVCEQDPESSACKAYTKFVSELLKRIEEELHGQQQ